MKLKQVILKYIEINRSSIIESPRSIVSTFNNNNNQYQTDQRCRVISDFIFIPEKKNLLILIGINLKKKPINQWKTKHIYFWLKYKLKNHPKKDFINWDFIWRNMDEQEINGENLNLNDTTQDIIDIGFKQIKLKKMYLGILKNY